MKLTEDEKWAVRDCAWCKLSTFDDDGNFVKCQSEDNDTGRPLLECQFQRPDYNQ